MSFIFSGTPCSTEAVIYDSLTMLEGLDANRKLTTEALPGGGGGTCSIVPLK